MRAKSFSAEKRQRQDQQAFVTLLILGATACLGWLWSLAAPYCWGALQGAWSPLLILTLRYGYRVVSFRRIDLWAVFDAVAFLGIFIAISVKLYPHDVWHAMIMLLCMISTIWGIKHFKYTPLFMFINCMIAGALLL